MKPKLPGIGLLIVAVLATCASCANMPGADGRYATHDRGNNNREGGRGLPTTPYVPG